MFKDNFKINKTCPICKSKKIYDKDKIKSKHGEINLMFSLMFCKSCGHKFLSEFPLKNYLEKLHKDDSKFLFDHDSNEVTEKERFKKDGFKKVKTLSDHWIFKHIDINQVGEYFEIGPGLCELYKTFYNKNWHCEGLDLQPFIIAPGIVNNLDDIKNESKDVAVALDVIEHTIDPLEFLKNINIKLKNGGKIFLSFPNADSFKSKVLNNNWDMVVPLAHLNFFSKKSIQISLENNGFEIIFIKNYSMGNFKRFIRNLIKLPFKLFKDLICLNISLPLTRFKEVIITLFDIIDGDQMMVVARKIK
tara:strand:- start:1914 stop:2825 length:912 start_codon:yes stop_codon:yes gene_type:complete